jgi:CBS domain-containing protein
MAPPAPRAHLVPLQPAGFYHREAMMLTLRDCMTRDLVTLNPDDTLGEAITLLSERFISGAPVLIGDEVVGVISAMDIMDFAANTSVSGNHGDQDEWSMDDTPDETASSYFTDLWDEGSGLLDEEQASAPDLLADHTVSEAMTRGLLTLPPETEVHVAAAFMIEHGVHRVIVASDGRLEGLVTTTDFLRLIADRRL